jgi:hypothetical protein
VSVCRRRQVKLVDEVDFRGHLEPQRAMLAGSEDFLADGFAAASLPFKRKQLKTAAATTRQWRRRNGCKSFV